MAILVDAGTRVIGQGITGRQGTFHAEQSIAYGTRFVACVTPGKGWQPTSVSSRPRSGRRRGGGDGGGHRRSSTFRPLAPPTP